jgi:deoxyribodipyrimidine photo-lyase
MIQTGMDERVRALNDQPVRRGGGYILYWCRWNRRVESNHALLYAAETANRMNLPLVCFERLSCAYPTASDRFHTFVLEGVPQMQAAVHKLGAGYIFQLPRRKTTSDERLRAVIQGAAAVVTDECLRSTPTLDVQLQAVDSSCIVPMSKIRAQLRRVFIVPNSPYAANSAPACRLPAPALRETFGICTGVTAGNIADLVASCEIDHSIRPPPPSTADAVCPKDARVSSTTAALPRAHKNDPSAHATRIPALTLRPHPSLKWRSPSRNTQADKLIAEEFWKNFDTP